MTNTEDNNDFATMEIERSDDTEHAEEVLGIMNKALAEDLCFHSESRYIVISDASDGEGYMYHIYNNQDEYEEGEDELDGGQCTGSLSDAIEMAITQ